ncbi:MAG: succinate dehydrogenase, hydrophobic membrane anchor protein [Gammaproteobacteria bacterium]
MKPAVSHWWAQRITAVVLTPLCLWFILALAGAISKDYDSVHAWIKAPLTGPLLILFILALFYHAQLGLQVVIEDYIGKEHHRKFCIILSGIIMLAAGLIATLSVLKVAMDA